MRGLDKWLGDGRFRPAWRRGKGTRASGEGETSGFCMINMQVEGRLCKEVSTMVKRRWLVGLCMVGGVDSASGIKGERRRDGVRVKGMAGRGRLSASFHASGSVAFAWERGRWPVGTWGRGHAW